MDSANQWNYLRTHEMEEYGSLTLFGEKSFVGDVSDSNNSTLQSCVARNSIHSSAGTGNGSDTEIHHPYATRKRGRPNTGTKNCLDTEIRLSSTTRKRTRSNTDISASHPKGVVLQQNGKWGCQIYANHQRFWLGTFKSEKEAAMAYDSASLKLQRDSHRNYPISDTTQDERTFQSLHSTESVINMIKDGTYQCMFAEFMKTRRIPIVGTELRLNNIPEVQSSKGLLCELLFQKELTPSDVGKLNRLVIPKKYAVMYFPKLAVDNKAKTAAKDPEDMELSFYDRSMKLWTFKYSYWSSSQSYVFTKGWNRFVKDEQLQTDDFVTFSRCKSQGNANLGFFMIDVKRGKNKAGRVMDADLSLQRGLNIVCEDVEEGEVEEEEVVVNEKQGFKLFGVKIF